MTTIDATTTAVATTLEETTVATAARTLSLSYPVPVDASRLHDLADAYNGTWTGNWAEESGGSGELHAIVTIDPATRNASLSFSFTGDFLQGGAGAPDLIEMNIPDGTTPETLYVTSSMVGQTGYTYAGGTTAEVNSDLPANAGRVSADVSLRGDSASASYTVMSSSGTAVLGAGIIARGRVPEPIDLPAIAAGQLNANLYSGRYAANLLAVDEASAAVGEPIDAILTNGGNLVYGSGIAASNFQAKSVSGDLIIQVTVVRGVDTPSIQAYWATAHSPSLPSIPGIGDDAFAVANTLYVLAGNLIAEIQVLALTDAPTPLDPQTSQRNIAVAMVPRMRAAT